MRPARRLRLIPDRRIPSPRAPVAVERVLGVGSHDDAPALIPAIVLAADGDASVEGDHDLDRVVCVRGHDALSSGGEEEATLPQVPARDLNQRYGSSFGLY